ncbi:MAG: DUF4188 domain-containing protein [Actinomycetota bacterium]|nr:DUF4188 domain-containing protein [Actinomycetota bacterium]
MATGGRQEGRYTAAATDEPVTVFLIGMRINRWWKVRSWLPVVTAMPAMIKHLANHQTSGFLAGQNWFGRTTLMLTYWRKAEDLVAFARDPELMHLPAWRAYNAAAGSNGDVGVWHETYRVAAGDREMIYVNMPPFGLGKAIGTERVGTGTATATQRMTRHG